MEGTLRSASEVGSVEHRQVTAAAIKESSVRATRQSAALENRTLPAGYVRPDGVKRVLARRRKSA